MSKEIIEAINHAISHKRKSIQNHKIDIRQAAQKIDRLKNAITGLDKEIEEIEHDITAIETADKNRA